MFKSVDSLYNMKNMIPIAPFFFILDTEQFIEGHMHVVFPDNPYGYSLSTAFTIEGQLESVLTFWDHTFPRNSMHFTPWYLALRFKVDHFEAASYNPPSIQDLHLNIYWGLSLKAVSCFNCQGPGQATLTIRKMVVKFPIWAHWGYYSFSDWIWFDIHLIKYLLKIFLLITEILQSLNYVLPIFKKCFISYNYIKGGIPWYNFVSLTSFLQLSLSLSPIFIP